MTIKEALLALRDARKNAEELRMRLDAARAGFEEAHKGLIDNVALAQIRVTKLYTDARITALAMWHDSDKSTKQIAAGVVIKENTVVTYDQEEAVQWSLDHNMVNLLRVDKASFETLAKTGSVDAAVVTKEPSAAIASDLTKALYSQEEFEQDSADLFG